jgi:hypothetical protein
MNNGCICCTVRGDLIRILGNLIKRRDKFDHMLVETTGLADPGPVAQTFFVDDEVRGALPRSTASSRWSTPSTSTCTSTTRRVSRSRSRSPTSWCSTRPTWHGHEHEHSHRLELCVLPIARADDTTLRADAEKVVRR